MPICPVITGMKIKDVIPLLEGLGFSVFSSDPLELPVPWTETMDNPPLWHRVAPARLSGLGDGKFTGPVDLPVGTEIAVRIYLQAGTRDYGRSDWSDFDEPDP